MQKFDENYTLLKEMTDDEYFPPFLVEKIKKLITPVIYLLENGESDVDLIQENLDKMTIGINDLQEEFEDNDSEIETVARESIAATIGYILNWFHIDIDIEDAIGERDW